MGALPSLTGKGARGRLPLVFGASVSMGRVVRGQSDSLWAKKTTTSCGEEVVVKVCCRGGLVRLI